MWNSNGENFEVELSEIDFWFFVQFGWFWKFGSNEFALNLMKRFTTLLTVI